MSQVTYNNATFGGGYNSSSYLFFGNEWNFSESFCSSELGIVDPDPIELFEGLNELPGSIYHDVQKIESSDSCAASVSLGELSEDFFENEIKPEIRNGDCMWSGNSAPILNSGGVAASTSTTKATTNNAITTTTMIDSTDTDVDTKCCTGITIADLKVTTALPLSMVTGKVTNTTNATEINHNLSQSNAKYLKVKSSTTSSSSSLSSSQKQKQQQQQQQQQQHESFPYYDLSATIKVEPDDNGYEMNNVVSSCNRKSKQNHYMQNIPPGTSLLRRKTLGGGGANVVKSSQQQNQFTHHLPKSNVQKMSNFTTNNTTNSTTAAVGATTTTTTVIPIPNVTASEFIRDREMHLSAAAAAAAATTTTPVTDTCSSQFVNNNKISGIKPTGGTTTVRTKLLNSSGGSTGGGAGLNVAFGRPDTPLSLDDDTTEFKHSVDLRACVMGSNNISLVSGNETIDNDPAIIIRDLREQLEDTSKKQIDIRRILPLSGGDDDDVDSRTLADVIAVINDDELNINPSPSSPISLQQSPHTTYRTWDTTDDDDDEEEEDDDDDDDDDDIAEDEDIESTELFGDDKFISTNSDNNHHSSQYPIMHSDHCYTRSKDGIDEMGTNLDTPSDSDEEIDVVSVGDKKLPTNPSAKDRRAIQTKVAYKFSHSRIVKTANGIRTIPPRRHGSCELPYTPASISPVKTGSPINNSRYPSPTMTICNNNNPHHQYSSTLKRNGGTTTKMSSSSSSKFTAVGQYNRGGSSSVQTKPIPAAALLSSQTSTTTTTASSRKRFSVLQGGGGETMPNQRKNLLTSGGGGVGGSSKRKIDDGDDYVPPSKRYRSKRQKHSNSYLQQQQQQQQQHCMQQRNANVVGNNHILLHHHNNKQYQQQQQQQQNRQSSSSSSASSSASSSSSNDETPDTIEKRNLHNDMERQRRIGLKNLFEGLKAQIPTLQDKDRAPKVNILREAAKLCENLVREDQKLMEQKAMLQEQLMKRQELLNYLRSAMQMQMN